MLASGSLPHGESGLSADIFAPTGPDNRVFLLPFAAGSKWRGFLGVRFKGAVRTAHAGGRLLPAFNLFMRKYKRLLPEMTRRCPVAV